MSAEVPPKKVDDFDVVLMLPTPAATDEGATRVLRARPGRIEAGEVRPMPEGRPLASGGEIVRLSQRADAPALFDVHVECTVPPPTGSRAVDGPAQVATRAYRDSWDRTFGPRRQAQTLN